MSNNPNAKSAAPSPPSPEDETPASKGGVLRGILITVPVLVLIAWATVFFALRTAVGRDSVRGRIESWTGMQCSLGGSALAFPCGVRLLDVALREPGADADCVRIARLDLRRGFYRGTRILLENATLMLRQKEDGAWHPQRLAVLSAALDEELHLIGSAVRSLGPHHRMVLSGVNIQWIHAEGQVGGEVRNLDFQSYPGRIPNRSMHYHELRFTRLGDGDTGDAGQHASAWISTESADFIEVPLVP